MTDKQLSPEAQAVLDATNAAYDDAATVREGTAAAIRELVFQLQYYNCLEGEDMLIDACAVLDIAEELEGK
jgi:hypothetical protein